MEMTWITALFVGAGALMVGLAIPFRRRKVAPNRLYGLRTPSTLADERVWYAVNAKAGADLALIGYALIVATLGLAFWGGAETVRSIGILTALSVIPIVVSAVARSIQARRQLHELRAADSHSEPPA